MGTRARTLPIILAVGVLPSLSHPGIGIVMDSHGNVFYTDLEHVWKISRDGKKSIAVHTVHTHELYIDSADNLYGEHLWYNGEATNTWGHRVWRLTAQVSSQISFLRGEASWTILTIFTLLMIGRAKY